MKLARLLLLTLLSATALAAPAKAATATDATKMRIPDIQVEPGVIEHTETEYCWYPRRSYPGAPPSGCHIRRSWVASNRDHEVFRAPDGRLFGESATVDGTIFSWTAEDDEMVIATGRPGRPSLLSFAAEAGMWRDTIARGWYAATGEEDLDGRTVVRYRETEDAPPAEGRDTVLVDPETFQVVLRRLESSFGSGTERLLTTTTLPRTPDNERLLQLADHPTATMKGVTGREAAVAKAARKAGLKSRTRAKIRDRARKARR